MSLRLNVNIVDWQNNLKRVSESVRKIDRTSPDLVDNALKVMSDEVHDEIERTLSGPRSGYTWSKDAEFSRGWWDNFYDEPSASRSEAPGSKSGDLLESIKFRRISGTSAALDVGGSPLPRPYAFYLEYGWTSDYNNPVPPRPFVAPAVGAVRGKISESLRDLYNSHLGGSGW